MMKDEIIEACEFCKMFDNGKCTLHKIDVCYNDEPCRDFIEGEKGGKE